MSKFKKIYRYIAIFIALIVALIMTLVEAFTYDEFLVAINNPPCEEDYQILKEYAIVYAKSLDKNSINDDKIDIPMVELKDESIIVTVEEFRCQVKATYPIKFEQSSNTGEIITIISLEDGTYEESSKLQGIWQYILEILILFFSYSVVFCFVIYFPTIWIVTIGVRIIKQIKKKKAQ